MISWLKIFLFLSLALSIHCYVFTEEEYTAMKAISVAIGNIVKTYRWNISSYNCSDWANVECFGVVSSLNFKNSNLFGSIPKQIGLLTNLLSIDMADNYGIKTTIPTQIGNLTALVNLNMANNSLYGTIPTQIGNLTTLENLDLYFNNLSGTLPTELGHLEKLTQISLGSNMFEGSIPTEFGQLKNLHSLKLFNNNKLNGTIPSQFSSLSNISAVFLSSTKVNNCWPDSRCILVTPCIKCDCVSYNLSCNTSCCYTPVGESTLEPGVYFYDNITITQTATLAIEKSYLITNYLNSNGTLKLNSFQIQVNDNFTLGEDSTISIIGTRNLITVGNCAHFNGALNITLLNEAVDNQTLYLMEYRCRIGEFKKLNLILEGVCEVDLEYGSQYLMVIFPTTCNPNSPSGPVSNSASHLVIVSMTLFICLIMISTC